MPTANLLLQPPKNLIERVEEADAPRTELGRQMLRLWNDRPQDGLQLGRDIPSKQSATLLTHLMVFQPTHNFDDLTCILAGEVIRARFGEYVVGKKLSELLRPEVFALQIARSQRVIAQDTTSIEHISLFSRDEVTAIETVFLTFDLVLMPVWTKDRSAKTIITGTFFV